MFLLDLPTTPDVDGSYASERFRPAKIEKAIAPGVPNLDAFQTFKLHRRFLALNGEREPLRLLSEPEVYFDVASQRLVVKDWGVVLRGDQLTDISREMARQFMRLWQASEHGSLTADQSEIWNLIVRQVDMDAFHRSLEMPRYMEGQMAGSSNQVYVCWPGENGSEKVPFEFSSEFNLINSGEWFGAYFLFDENGKISRVERLIPIPTPTEDIWDQWPPLAP